MGAGPRALHSELRKVKRLQREVSCKRQRSANRRKAAKRLAKVHQRVAKAPRNTLHQTTTKLAKTKSVIVLADLMVPGC